MTARDHNLIKLIPWKGQFAVVNESTKLTMVQDGERIPMRNVVFQGTKRECEQHLPYYAVWDALCHAAQIIDSAISDVTAESYRSNFTDDDWARCQKAKSHLVHVQNYIQNKISGLEVYS